MMKFLNGTAEDVLTLAADNLHCDTHYWFADSSFAVHPDFESHTGGSFTFGFGSPINASAKQKLNTRSSTEAELVGADDMVTPLLWTRLFMDAQGYPAKKIILFQDNMSTIKLLLNGKKSSSKRTRAINIRYFFLTDQIEKGHLEISYCHTKFMVADYFTKPLQGSPEVTMRNWIMGKTPIPIN